MAADIFEVLVKKWKKILLGWILFKYYRILLNYNKENYVVVIILRCIREECYYCNDLI